MIRGRRGTKGRQAILGFQDWLETKVQSVIKARPGIPGCKGHKVNRALRVAQVWLGTKA